MEKIVFTKMHGLGNDYIYINCMDKCPERLEELSIAMSPRHTSVGSDGIILILPSEIADFRMRIFNADGSEAKMCGNGSRCVGKYVYDHGLTTKQQITLETNSGVKYLQLHVSQQSGKVESVTVDMGLPSLLCKDVPVTWHDEEMVSQSIATENGPIYMTAVSMGNPHGVVFTDNIEKIILDKIGPELENHAIWPDRANIEFAEVLTPSLIKMRVWERGSGETMACGTGACAVAVAAFRNGLADRKVTIQLPGGKLDIEIDETTGHVMMTGPAVEVFKGEYFRSE